MIGSHLLGLLGFTACAPTGDGADKLATLHSRKGNPKLRVLFIGNSYSFEVPSEFARLARSRGKKVAVAQATLGGWTLEKHLTQPETLEKLHGSSWDVVVLQDHSTHPGSDDSVRSQIMEPALREFAVRIRSMGAVPLLYQTWGRRDGLPGSQGKDFYEMNGRVRRGCQCAAEAAGGIRIVPVGDAWEREYRAGRGPRLFQEDGSHPSTAGDQVTAAVFYHTIFGEEPDTGKM